MNEEELTPHLEELKKVLNGKIDEKTLIDELSLFLDTYHIDIESAKRGIIRKYGGTTSGFVTAASIKKKIGELNGTEQNVDITAKVIYVEKKDITVKGNPKTIVSGILGDETGTASFTDWEGKAVLEKGAVYRFKNCYSKKWNDRIGINLGNRASIEPADENINVPERNYTMSSAEMKIGEIRDGVGNVTVTGRIMTMEVRQITIKGEERTVYSGIIADDTGKIQYSAWKDFELKQGDAVRIKDAYIRSWKGIPQLNLGDRCEVSKVDDVFNDASIGGSTERTIGDIVKNGGGLDIILTGTVVDLRLGSGIIYRCPQCNRSILNGNCITHGAVEPIPDLRMKFVLDDGTGSINAIVNRDLTEKLTGITLKAATECAKANSRGAEMVIEDMSKKMLIKRIRIRGNVMSDDYGPSMIVKEADIVNVDIVAEATKLLKDVEAAL